MVGIIQAVGQDLVSYFMVELREEDAEVKVEIDVAVAPVAAEQERPVRVSNREILDPGAAVVHDERIRVQGTRER